MSYSSLKTPGVYVKEISIFPPSVAQVPTAIPAFVGYTQKHQDEKGDSLQNKAWKIGSMLEFVQFYGGGPELKFNVGTGHAIELDTATNQVIRVRNQQNYYLHDSMQLFFANGGGECYIVSVDKYRSDGTVDYNAMSEGLKVLEEVDEPTMLVFPDAVSMGTNLYKLQQDALKQCGDMMDRVGVFDLHLAETKTQHDGVVKAFRDSIGMANLKYGAAYTPWLKVGLQKNAKYKDLKGNVVKPGTNVAVDLSTLIKGFSAADTTTIKNLLTTLDELTHDNAFIGGRISSFLASANAQFAQYAPAGFPGGTPLPSLQQGFELLAQSAANLMSAAEADPTNANTNAAAAEIRKMVRQAYNIAFLLDDIGCAQPGFMQHTKLLEQVWSELGFSSPFPAGIGTTQLPLPAGTFRSTISLLNQWDDAISTNTQGTDNLFETLPGGGAVRSQAPFAASFAVYDNAIAVAAPPPGIAITPPNNGARIANQRIAADALKNIFTYLLGVLNNIQAFGQSLEKSAEDTLLAIWPVYKNLVAAVNSSLSILPPSGAIAGIYARVDNERGVWKAPANVSVTYAEGTLVNITDTLQASLNVDVDAGKSINVIRVFSGKGTMVWGARTLAGNDNEWRYVPVRRFFNMVEESVKKSTAWVVFEPNDANTWVKVKGMIENFLVLQWRAGALAGAKPEEAFFVKVGLNQTMSAIDILEGRLIVQIGMAVVRPAEFIILEFSHKLQTS